MAQAKSGILKSKRSSWRRWSVRLLLIGIIGFFVTVATARWLLGPQWLHLYGRQMQRQLDWYEPRYPTLAPLWMILKAPIPPGSHEETALLLEPGSEDRFDPMAEILPQLPARLLATYLTGAADGATVTLPPGRYTDCARIVQPRLTLVAERKGTAIFDGGACDGKATLVATGAELTLDGLAFRNVRVPDGNGAGVRLEQGALIVRNSIFYNSENAILTIAEGETTLDIADSLFVRLGRCDGILACGHSIYAGKIARVRLHNNIFRFGAGGHFAKLRARDIEVTGNEFDGRRGKAGFHIDLPNGSSGLIDNNRFHIGKNSGNRRAVISIAAEGRLWDSSGLNITGNEVISDIPLTVFVQNKSGDEVSVHNNQLPWNIVTSSGAVR
jgi:hypothetical protein